MKGLLKEGEERIKEGGEPEVLDAGLISAARVSNTTRSPLMARAHLCRIAERDQSSKTAGRNTRRRKICRPEADEDLKERKYESRSGVIFVRRIDTNTRPDCTQCDPGDHFGTQGHRSWMRE